MKTQKTISKLEIKYFKKYFKARKKTIPTFDISNLENMLKVYRIQRINAHGGALNSPDHLTNNKIF